MGGEEFKKNDQFLGTRDCTRVPLLEWLVVVLVAATLLATLLDFTLLLSLVVICVAYIRCILSYSHLLAILLGVGISRNLGDSMCPMSEVM